MKIVPPQTQEGKPGLKGWSPGANRSQGCGLCQAQVGSPVGTQHRLDSTPGQEASHNSLRWAEARCAQSS